jgi:hypothetical protein
LGRKANEDESLRRDRLLLDNEGTWGLKSLLIDELELHGLLRDNAAESGGLPAAFLREAFALADLGVGLTPKPLLPGMGDSVSAMLLGATTEVVWVSRDPGGLIRVLALSLAFGRGAGVLARAESGIRTKPPTAKTTWALARDDRHAPRSCPR